MNPDDRHAFVRNVYDTGGWTDQDSIIADAINDAVTAGLLAVPAQRIGERNAKVWIAARRISEDLQRGGKTCEELP